MSRLRKVGLFGSAVTAVGILTVSTVGGFEGLRLAAYRDAVGIPTICYGETRGVAMGQRKSKPECEGMLVDRLDEFGTAVERCVTRPMRDESYAAFVSLSYNIGQAAFCRSSVVRYWNAGRELEACDAIMMWDRAGGRVLAGLTRRRAAERDLCRKGAA